MQLSTKFKTLFLKATTIGKQKVSSVYDFLLYSFNIPVRIKTHSNNNQLQVIYVGENLAPRISRMVKWMKKTDSITAILVCSKDGFQKKFVNDYFDEVLLFRNEWHMYRILKNFRGKKFLIHSFGPKSLYPDKARIFMKQNKFLYDMQDVLCIYFGLDTNIRWYQKDFPHEKNVLSLSDGLVSHGLEPISASKIYGIKKRPPVLFFPLYCDNDTFQSNEKDCNPDDIHIVYAGEVVGSFRDKKQYGHVQFHDTIAEFAKQKIHFHVYPSPSTSTLYYDEYRLIEKQNPFFHLHKPVAQSYLAKELSKYHFGFIPFFKGDTNQSDDKYKYSTSLKLFNFIEAGIPVLIAKDIDFQCWIVNRYSAGIPIRKDEIPSLRKIIEKVDYKKLVRGLISEREKISLKRNIKSLSDFYRKF